MIEQRIVTQRWGRGNAVCVLLIVLACTMPVVYLLSVGPVLRFELLDARPLQGARDSYLAPCEWLIDHTPLESGVFWYTDLWFKLPEISANGSRSITFNTLRWRALTRRYSQKRKFDIGNE
jgi:hypothetical protein